MITKGSKIQLINPMGLFDKTGEVCEVINVTEDAVITFKCSIGIGCMSYDEFEKYFKIYDDCKKDESKNIKKRKWSEWSYNDYVYFTFEGGSYTVPVKYRTNGKIVDLRTDYNEEYDEHERNIRVKAVCNKSDKFDLETGLNIADARLQIKLMQNELDDLIDDLTA